MGVHVLYDPEQRIAAIYDSVSGFAFGPTFTEAGDGTSAEDLAEEFIAAFAGDPRGFPDRELEDTYADVILKHQKQPT